MRAAPVVHQARERVAAFRRRLHLAGFSWGDDQPVDLETIAEILLNCPIVLLQGLSDRAAMGHLRDVFSFHGESGDPEDEALAGALYVSEHGLPRWIFVEAADRPQRRRFTVAHELGHLVIEAEPRLEKAQGEGRGFLEAGSEGTITRFSRCTDSVFALGGQPPARRGRGWSTQDLREIAANHFAAELLMPIDGVRRLISRYAGGAGLRSDRDVEQLVTAVAQTYDVSFACARTHLERDLRIVPAARDSNADLFA